VSYPPAATVGPQRASVLDGYQHLGVHKTGDTSRTSTTTLAADPHLSIAVAANAVYALVIRLAINAGATPDFRWDLSAPAAATISDYSYLAWGASSLHDYGTLPLLSSVGVAVGDGNVRPLTLWGTLITAGTAGNLALRWAQNTSSATATILKAGSSIHPVRIG
jgi:hypothetical protein